MNVDSNEAVQEFIDEYEVECDAFLRKHLYEFIAEDPNATEVCPVHDWRNYLPGNIMKHWLDLTVRERALLYIVCGEMASREVWE